VISLLKIVELHQKQQQRIRQVRQQIEEQNQAIMAVISSLLEAKQVLESSLENLDEKRAASADARSGKNRGTSFPSV